MTLVVIPQNSNKLIYNNKISLHNFYSNHIFTLTKNYKENSNRCRIEFKVPEFNKKKKLVFNLKILKILNYLTKLYKNKY